MGWNMAYLFYFSAKTPHPLAPSPSEQGNLVCAGYKLPIERGWGEVSRFISSLPLRRHGDEGRGLADVLGVFGFALFQGGF